MNKIEIVENFLNSLESEKMQNGQDALLLSRPQENYPAGTSLNNRCYNESATCISSQNEKKCFNEKGYCDQAYNFRRCKEQKPRWAKKDQD